MQSNTRRVHIQNSKARLDAVRRRHVAETVLNSCASKTTAPAEVTEHQTKVVQIALVRDCVEVLRRHVPVSSRGEVSGLTLSELEERVLQVDPDFNTACLGDVVQALCKKDVLEHRWVTITYGYTRKLVAIRERCLQSAVAMWYAWHDEQNA